MPTRYRFPPSEEHLLANGMHLTLVPDREQPAAAIALQFPRGRFADPPGIEGVGDLALALVQKATRRLPPERFAARMESTGSVLFSEVGEEHTIIGCRFLSRFAAEMVPLFWEMVTEPGLPAAEFKRLKKEMLTSLDAELADPMGIAHRHFHAELYGRDHPAGRAQSRRTVGRVKLDDVREWLGATFRPANASLVVGGDIDLGVAHSSWSELFAGWRPADPGPEHALWEAPARASRSPVVRLIHKPGLTQTTFVVGQLLPGEDSPHRNEVGLANYVLGGGNFSSRLMAEVRSRMGRTYGISSQVARCVRFGELTIGSSTQDAHVREMMETVRGVYVKLATEGITEDELAKARSYALGSLSFQLEGIGHIVERLLWLRLYGREKSYIEEFDTVLASATIATVNAAIHEYFKPDTLVVAAVGNRKRIEEQLRPLGTVVHYHFRADTD